MAGEWIRKLWYTYTTEYYSATKGNASESVLMRWMNLEPIIQSEVRSKSGRERQMLYTNAYTWNLERRHCRSCMPISKGDTDVKNRFLDSEGEGEGGMI